MLFLLLWTVAIYSFAALFHSDIVNAVPLIRQIRYDASLLYLKITMAYTGEPWWNLIEPTPHYLGAQPQADWGHEEQVARLNVDAVLILLEEFEERGGWLHKPVQVHEWAGPLMGMAVYAVRARDFMPLRFVELDAALQWLREQDRKGHRVYVHCKAGRGRSASVFWAYLILDYGMAPEDAMARLTRQRPSINIGEAQRQLVLDYVRYTQCRADPTCIAVHDNRFIMMTAGPPPP
jgi:hypothetical protein